MSFCSEMSSEIEITLSTTIFKCLLEKTGSILLLWRKEDDHVKWVAEIGKYKFQYSPR
jgi:hypothetical protein